MITNNLKLYTDKYKVESWLPIGGISLAELIIFLPIGLGEGIFLIWFLPLILIPALAVLTYFLRATNASNVFGSHYSYYYGLEKSDAHKLWDAYKEMPKELRKQAGINLSSDTIVNMTGHDQRKVTEHVHATTAAYHAQQAMVRRTDATSIVSALESTRQGLEAGTQKMRALD